MSLHAVVLAGGYGTRLLPFTRRTPKHLLPIGDEPVIAHQLHRLAAAGVESVVLATSYHADAFRPALGDGDAYGVRLRYSREEHPLGTGGALRHACGLLDLASDDDVLVLNGDLITEHDLGAQVAAHPASYVAFDVLALGGTDLREKTLGRRRAELETLAARWAPPLQLSPSTSDPELARQWFEDFRVAGVEGLVAKGAGGRYAPGRREWLKVKSWESTEVLAGGVIGALDRPSQVVAGRYRDGELVVVGRTSPLTPRQSEEVVVGRTSPLTPRQSEEVAAVLEPADDDHPWPDRIGTGRFGGGRLSVPLTRVRPDVVVEVSADAALQAGVFRHPLRFLRVRPDLRPEDLPLLP